MDTDILYLFIINIFDYIKSGITFILKKNNKTTKRKSRVLKFQ